MGIQVVAGLSVKNLQPPVWNPHSPYFLGALKAVMVSYAEFPRSQARTRPANPTAGMVDSAKRQQAMENGLRAFLEVPDDVDVYLDNGAFNLSSKGITTDVEQYQRFVEAAGPDWKPIAQDFIPLPSMSDEEQMACLTKTMAMNRQHEHDGYVPVIHISPLLSKYLEQLLGDEELARKGGVALGAIVPNLLRAKKAMAYDTIVQGLKDTRKTLAGKQLHVFGIGGTATLHLAALLGFDSADSCGWRNRAARGIVQLPGSGDRSVVEMGSWRGRKPDANEWALLEGCRCPPCQDDGVDGLKADKLPGFCHRATHNLWVLLEEARWIEEQLAADTYEANFRQRLDNSIYLPLIERVAETVGSPNREAPDREQPQADVGTGEA